MNRVVAFLLLAVSLAVAVPSNATESVELFGKSYKVKVIEAGPISMPSSGRWSCHINLRATDLLSESYFLHHESNCDEGFFSVQEIVNGCLLGSGGGRSGHWAGGTTGLSRDKLRIGDNTIEFVDESEPGTNGGQIRNVQLYIEDNTAESEGWYPGDPHHHTTFSDGSNNVPQVVLDAKKHGLKWMGISDHHEQIASKEKEPAKYGKIYNPGGIDIGWTDYLRNCHEQSRDGEFVVIPSTEITTFWRAEPDTCDASHTLELGLTQTASDSVIDSLELKFDTQDKLIERIHELGHLAIAAHKALLKRGEVSFTPWELQRLRYDCRTEGAYAGIDGVEFFNCDNEAQEEEVLNWYLEMMKKHQNVLASTGSDLHGWLLAQGDRPERKFWVKAKALTMAELLLGMKRGQTYAADHGVRIISMNFCPGFEKQVVNNTLLSFDLDLGENKSSKMTCLLYRDGELVNSKPLINMENICNYSYTDRPASGEHWYNLVIKGYLVTSPIVLEVKN